MQPVIAPTQRFADPKPVSIGVGHRLGVRNSPTRSLLCSQEIQGVHLAVQIRIRIAATNVVVHCQLQCPEFAGVSPFSDSRNAIKVRRGDHFSRSSRSSQYDVYGTTTSYQMVETSLVVRILSSAVTSGTPSTIAVEAMSRSCGSLGNAAGSRTAWAAMVAVSGRIITRETQDCTKDSTAPAT